MSSSKFTKKYNLPDPVCLYKWQWSTVRLQQQTSASCHRVMQEEISVEEFADFHNAPGTVEARQKMLNGEWPGHGCEYCKKLEDVGSISDRQDLNNNSYEVEHLVPPETKINNLATNLTASTIEVYFSNLCNMACLYCNKDYSSRWEQELIKHKMLSDDKVELIQSKKKAYPEIKEKFWEWMDAHASSLKKYNILGGEPFYQPEIWENLDFFDRHPCPDLTVNIFSNFKVENKKFLTILEKFNTLVNDNKLNKVNLFASIDGLGKEEEYVRYGLDSEQWKQNYHDVCTLYPDIKVLVHLTLCVLNLKAAIPLVDHVNNYIRNRCNTAMTISLLDGNLHLNPGSFPNHMFDKDYDRLYNRLRDPNLKDRILGLKQIANNTPYNEEAVDELKEFLDGVDKRRKLNWRATYPWLHKFYKKREKNGK